MKRTQWAATLLAILLFSLGLAVGVLADRYYHAATVNAKTAEDWREHYIHEMRSKLKLSDDQVNKLETILDDTKAQYKAVRDSYRPAMLKIKQEQIGRVKSILTPGQVAGYEKLVAEREQRNRIQEEQERQREQKEEAEHQKAKH